MPHGDDLDTRFNELVSQIDKEEQRRMRAAARRAAKTGRPGGGTDRLPGYLPEPEPAPRSRRGWLMVAAVAALIVAGAVVVTYRPDVLAPLRSAASGAVPEETMPVVAAPLDQLVMGPADGSGTDLADPFAGSPAEKYAEGIDGFAMPEAKALGGLPEKDVAKGLRRTRELLAAAYLDKKTLLGGAPDAFARLLDRGQRDWFREELDDPEETTRTLVNSFAPKTAELTTDVIKVKGRTTLTTFKEKGLRGVKAKFNYLVVYAVQRPGRPATAMRLVTHLTGTVQIYHEAGRLVVWVSSWDGSATPARCDVEDGFIHPYYDDSPPDKVPATGAPEDPYDLEDEPRHDDGCSASQAT
ncbi:hypothetical protein E1286_43480 [Nonomuraea terrae]|uniref:Uncharacterized protein n=1 Tax=Nonomuraea terrae TaxID=2530383 RepID=A0A4R4XMV2_9ACTN|nr:hypothetical protein [Nonomuraea terrae]TDD32561.1 hypothetical protein E1286_43480 [Nonomuraea terrae]